MKLHGGDLDIRSRVGKGTRVIVRLPVDGERRRALEPRARGFAKRYHRTNRS